MNQTRRALLRTTFLIAPALALASCSGVTGAVDAVTAVAPQVARDVAAIAAALAAILPDIASLTGASAAVISRISASIEAVRATASAIGGATTSTASGLVQQFVTGVTSVVGMLGGVHLPTWVSAVLVAAGSLLPIIEQGVGIPTHAPRMARTMAPDQARRVLASAATR